MSNDDSNIIPPWAKDLPEGAVLFNLSRGAGKQPPFPPLPADMAVIPSEVLVQIITASPAFLLTYIENDQFDEAKNLAGVIRRVQDTLAERDRVAAETCTCENCVAGRKARDEAVSAIASARGVPPAAVNNNGETLH